MSEARMDTAIHIFQVQTEMLMQHGLDVGGRSFQLFGEINEKMLKRVDSCLTVLERDSRSKRITIKLSSDGGSTHDAMAIVGRICSSPCKVTVEAYGIVASAATLILACADKRKCSSLCQFMWHESQYMLAGRHSSNKSVVRQQDREEALWASTMATFTGSPADEWADRGVHIDTWLTPAELKVLNVIDEIMEAK